MTPVAPSLSGLFPLATGVALAKKNGTTPMEDSPTAMTGGFSEYSLSQPGGGL
jgi:hypothetical protein